MMQEKAEDFGRDGLGVAKPTSLTSDELKRVESSLLTGEHVLDESFVKELLFRIAAKNLNWRAAGKYTVMLPAKLARACYFDLRVVPEAPGDGEGKLL